MTVEQLIAELQKCPPTARVEMRDDTGACGEVLSAFLTTDERDHEIVILDYS